MQNAHVRTHLKYLPATSMLSVFWATSGGTAVKQFHVSLSPPRRDNSQAAILPVLISIKKLQGCVFEDKVAYSL